MLATAAMLGSVPAASAATFTVTETTDEADLATDGACDASAAAGSQCTLRAAIQESNATPPTDDDIEFGIPGAGAHTITLGGALTEITDQVTIDGYTQPGSTANTGSGFTALDTNLNVTLDANGSASFLVSAGGTTIRGLAIDNAGGNGITLRTGGGNVVEGNFIGTDRTGLAAVPNAGAGVRIESGNGNRIGGTAAAQRNLISGNSGGSFALAVLSYGIWVEGGTGTVIQGNLVGTDAAGTGALGNQLAGVRIGGFAEGAANSTVGGTVAGAGNVLSANGGSQQGWGVFVGTGPGGTGIKIQGNRIGTTVAGTAALGNNPDGIDLLTDESVTVGGATSGAGNLISGNVRFGLQLSSGEHVVQGNRIGTNAAGTGPVPNNSHGIYQNGNVGSQIGADTEVNPLPRNLISGNGGSGVVLAEVASGNFVQGNYIGTDATGTAAVANGGSGVIVEGGTGNLIGGTFLDPSDGGEGNLIAGNGAAGVRLQPAEGPTADDNDVNGNLIGTQTDAVAALGNGGPGVWILGGDRNVLGSKGGSNVIASNGADGVLVEDASEQEQATGNTITVNSIFGNTGLGIDLGTDGVTHNDTGDADAGANNGQNFPVLYASDPAAHTISGTLLARPNTTYTVELFESPACDPSGNGEGRDFLELQEVTTDGAGFVNFTNTSGVAPPLTDFLTATATDPAGNTSEFSPCRQSGTSGQPQQPPTDTPPNDDPGTEQPGPGPGPGPPPVTPPVTPPPTGCTDKRAPITSLGRSGVKRGRVTLTLRGRSRDRPGCHSGLRKVEVSLARVNGRTGVNCRFIRRSNRYVLTPRKNCRRPTLFRATGRSKWTFTFAVRLRRGDYRAQARATDKAGNKETPRKRRNIVFFTVR